MMVLHGSAGSPYVARVRMQGYAKGLDLETRPAAPGTPEFLAMNPIGRMPVLEHDGFFLPESLIICEYLEDLHPTPSLLGDTPRERALVRLIPRTLDLYCGGLFPLLRAGVDAGFAVDAAAERAGLTKGLTALEQFLRSDGYAAREGLSLADCVLVPWLYYGRMLAARGDALLTQFPKLTRYAEAMAADPLARRVWGEMDESFRAFMTRWQAEQEAARKA
ncbi:glutathione S-transferase family protein [Azospirillum doebereinerae]|uniref:Glutathione S-transferase family protein n=1 Tax=Azospirillum doebereinerae TaxID=92933 RepID=A0A3S0VFA4_9PROT|nr:glutathione S-transferase family protein [Azospirillum doebereinerae]MCG5242154.1 glutathione S-transferase family protein [Azospirillum doebereinerae]RUQ66067.1 glutathione S-transferase family protein [Azospirillum doebereinerae]